MIKVLLFTLATGLGWLSYTVYSDAQQKKRDQIIQIVSEPKHDLTIIPTNNPYRSSSLKEMNQIVFSD